MFNLSTITILIVSFILLQNSLQTPVTEEYSVLVSNGKCVLESRNFQKIGNNWYDLNNCKMYECFLNGVKAVVKQNSCSDSFDRKSNCRMQKETGMFPTCCYGSIVCDRRRSTRHSKREPFKNMFEFMKK
ncbi:venom peptide MmKTx1-like [Centruroides sculpturatus]|uniref:venom peptide MmKTx1-like n=1 Tax=Centruroides sculpturatus TaxID=218467 RepID=UPI000C6D1281|nr:venom peptide MmKTx1-like [Centruroides sculpturatus]